MRQVKRKRNAKVREVKEKNSRLTPLLTPGAMIIAECLIVDQQGDAWWIDPVNRECRKL